MGTGESQPKPQKPMVQQIPSEVRAFQSNRAFVSSSVSQPIQLEEEIKKKFQLQLEEQKKKFEKEEQQLEKEYETKKKARIEELERQKQLSEKQESEDDNEIAEEVSIGVLQERNFLFDEKPAIGKIEEGKEMNVNQLAQEAINFLQDELKKKKEKKYDNYIKAKEKIMKEMKDQTMNKEIIMKINEEFRASQEKILTDKDKIMHNFDLIYHLNPKNTIHLCENLLKKPTAQEMQESIQLQAKFIRKIKEKGDEFSGVEVILLALKNLFTKNGGTFTFHQHSTAKTQLSVKILTSGFLENTLKFVEHIKDDDKWNFNELYENDEKKNDFKKWYKQRVSQKYKIDEQSISITKIKKGSTIAHWMTTRKADEYKVLQASAEQKQFQVHPYFKHFGLSHEDFDRKGNIQFHSDPPQNDFRGGLRYYPPVHCKRYGLKVSQKYDQKNDQWLAMTGAKGEWAVAFHGVSCPDKYIDEKREKKVINSIMQGREQGKMLKAGFSQAYRFDNAVNSPKQKVGQGIYCSPHFQECLGFYTKPTEVEGKSYHLILQCRVKPQRIKICPREAYWVINNSEDIRPYGILLVNEKEVRKVKPVKELFGKEFNWKDSNKKER